MSFRFLARSARPLSQAIESRVPFSFRTVQQGRATAAVRNYSATPETGAKENDAAAENADKATEATKEDPTLKELEAKKKEVADVTVRSSRQIQTSNRTTMLKQSFIGQVEASDRRVPQLARADQA
jgi:molecular chaperone GrpE